MTQKGGNYFFTILLLIAASIPSRGSGYRSVQLMFLICQPCGFRACRSAITQKALFPIYTTSFTTVPGYVFHSAFLWDFHYPRDKLGCLPFESKGIIFCTGLKSNHFPPHSIVSRQEGAQGEVLLMPCSVSLDKLTKCMQEGGSCNLHSASPISEQASHKYLATEARNLNRIPNHTLLLAFLLGISTVLHCTPCTITRTGRQLTEKRQPEWLLMENNGRSYQ